MAEQLMRSKTLVRTGFKAAVVILIGSMSVSALEVQTHVLVGQQAVATWATAGRNHLDDILQGILDIPAGRATVLNGRQVQEWIDIGNRMEDEGWAIRINRGRYFNHFHDPLKQWDDAGLRFDGPNQSSALWLENREQSQTAAGGNWSWHDARRMYYQAVTAPEKLDRDALMAATFRAIGQVMHLIVDASNPDHARNDPHGLPSALPIGLFWNYDKWILSRHTGVNATNQYIPDLLRNPIPFDVALLQQVPAAATGATVPIGRLIDADVYNGANPEVTAASVNVGLAEVANANFFSEDTLTGQYPFPRLDTQGLEPFELATPRRTPDGLQIVRRYWSRPGSSGLLPAFPLRAECLGSQNPRSATRPYACVDGVVWDEVARHMLPRAVGYARGVLDYFFRGHIEGVALYARGVVDSNPGIFLDVVNRGSEELSGRFEVYARHDARSPNEQRQRVATVRNNAIMTIAPGQRVAIPLTLDPVTTAVADLMLVFRGRLGAEEDAVVARAFWMPSVFLLQDRAEAAAFNGPQCSTSIITDSRHVATCTYSPVNRRVSGRIVTTRMGRTAPPQLVEVIAFSQNTLGGPGRRVTLTLDGVTQPNGMWTRTSDEPDPSTFVVEDAQPYVANTELILHMRYIGGPILQTGLVELGITTAVHEKRRQSRSVGSTNWWLVRSERRATVDLVYNRSRPGRPFFIPLAIGGYPYPYSDVEDRDFQGLIFKEGIQVNEIPGFNKASFIENVFDHFEQSTNLNAMRDLYRSIGPIVSPPADGPSWQWTAKARRMYDPHELDFMEAFGLEGLGEHEIMISGPAVD
jgi:hypothetical protein